MLGSNKVIAFLGARDPTAARAFFRDTLGLPLVSEDEFALVFDAGGTMLRVSFVQEMTPAKYTVLGWQVPDIATTVAELRDLGVRFEMYQGVPQDEFGIWEAPSGALVAWFTDPSGNILSLTQFPRTARTP